MVAVGVVTGAFLATSPYVATYESPSTPNATTSIAMTRRVRREM